MSYIGTEIFRLYDEAKAQYPDFDTWTSEAVHDTFGEEKRDALMAAKICKTTTLPWTNADVFENIALVLNGRPVFPDISQDATMKEITFAVEVLNKEFPDDEFSDELCTYFVAEADEDGMVVMPPVLAFVQPFIPKFFLNDEQQHIQNEYLAECNVYCEFLWKATEGKLPFDNLNKEVSK